MAPKMLAFVVRRWMLAPFCDCKPFAQALVWGAVLVMSLPGAVLARSSAELDSIDRKSIEGFYAGRQKLIWFSGTSPAPAANVLSSILKRAEVEGLPNANALAIEVKGAIEAGRKNPDAASLADRALSAVWIRYVQELNAVDPEFDNAVALPPAPPSAILTFAAAAPSLVDHLLSISNGNPKYSELRDALWNDFQTTGNPPSQRAIANLRRVRFKPPRERYVIVDTAAAELFMFEGSRQVDSMRVIVGTDTTPTPLIASTIYSVTINPYWNVPKDLVQRLIAPRVLARGSEYLENHGYEIVLGFEPTTAVIENAPIDWEAIAAGRSEILVRERPGPGNSMGRLKVWFPNRSDIFFHDTPDKGLFRSPSRKLSNGCIRLEDADRFARWLLQAAELPTASAPDHEVPLPQPVPVYVTRLTMRAR